MNHTSHDATTTAQTPQAREAHRLADLGYRIFPCVAGKKIPAVEGGCLAATCDPDTISRWWTRWPSANVAISTTALLALDVDRLADGSPNPWLTAERLDALARGPMAQTPRGGRHFIFRAPAGANLRCTASTIAPRVDTRADGGYIVVSPSVTDVGRYQWCDGYPLDCAPDDLPLPPQWLMDALSRHRVNGHSHPASTGDGAPITEGTRNSTLTSVAGAMRRKGCGQLEILAALRAANARCSPMLDDAEISRIASSVSRYEPQADAPAADPDHDGRPPIEKYSIGDLQAAYPTLHRPAIQGLIRAGETANIISVSKIGKSWLAYYIALSVATARTIFDRFPTHGGNVLLIDNELHKPTIAQRIRTVADAMGIDAMQYAERIDVWPLRGNLRSIHELADEFDGIEPGAYALIILDAKYRMIGDAASENDNAAETRFYNTVDRLAERTGAAVLMIHHSSKGSQSDKRVTDVGAGAGAQSRAADCHLVLREHEEDDAVVLAAAVRSFPPVEPLCLRWRFPLWEPDESLNPDELKGKKSESEERQGKRDADAQSAVLDAADGWKSRPELMQAAGLGYGRLDRAIAGLVKGGFLERQEVERPGKRGPKSVTQYRKTIKARA